MDDTTAGKLFALHSGNGRLVWSLSLDKDVPLTRLYLGVSSHDPGHAPIVLLLGSTPQRGVSVAVNGHTGEVLDTQALPGGIEKVHLPPPPFLRKQSCMMAFVLSGKVRLSMGTSRRSWTPRRCRGESRSPPPPPHPPTQTLLHGGFS